VANARIEVTGFPSSVERVLVRRYRIDERHSNSWTAWKEMGSPQQPSPEQHATIEAAGELQEFNSPEWITVQGRAASFNIELPRQSVSLLQLSW